MFRIKICGITRPQDALQAAKAGADAIGLNFFSGSKRYLCPESAMPLVEELRSQITDPPLVIGVFVDHTLEQIESIAESLQLDAVQLHGKYDLEFASRFELPVVMVLAFSKLSGESSTTQFGESLQQVSAKVRSSTSIKAVLLDRMSGGQFGGTGQSLDWTEVQAKKLAEKFEKPVILAGGLNPENVRSAIEQSGAMGVDVAGGVESEPGEKSDRKMIAFVNEANKGLVS